ncbi:MAG: hypothetical protein ACD_19C00015G0002 [uncultured bacterium]|nr:MAG: hypothetical protein ACD_19C00015G0002 [uncultured bacterium]
MQDFDAKLGIYSFPDIFIEKLSAKFTEKYLDVIVFNNSDNVVFSDFNYLIVNLLNNEIDLNKVKEIVSKLECKIIVLYPLFVKTEEKYVAESNSQSLLELNKNIGIILVPEILGNEVKFNPRYLSHDLIMQSILSERVKIDNSGQLINAISIGKLIEVVVKEIFSFGVSGQQVALIGPRRSPKSFINNYLNISEQNIVTVNEKFNRTEVSHTSLCKVDFSLRLAVKATKTAFSDELNKKELNIDIKKPTKKSTNKKLFNNFYKLLLFFLFFLSLPVITLLFSLSFLFISIKFASSDIRQSEKFVFYSLQAINATKNVSFGIPFYYNYSNIIYKSAFIFQEALELSKIGNEFATKIMGDNTYDLELYSDGVSAILDRIHTDIDFLQSDINELDDYFGKNLKVYISNKKIDVNNIKNDIYAFKSFTSRLSVLLGMNKPMKYLVLFQNNMELRPTGGFIGSFAIVTFDKGRMSEIVVSDIYSADGQLKGHVDPPEPIRIHLGEGGWYMRDANWDPDFSNSAKKIEWFLDKETSNQVDGVIAIDLSFVESILKIIGSIKIIDYDKTISAENLYLTTQEEVESKFFPGSIKKASFMTSLAKSLIAELEVLKSDKYFTLIKEVYSSLEERHVQLFFHDLNAQESIKNLGYSGNINTNTDCGIRCFNDNYSLIDANLGVNKSNLFVRRLQEINLNVSKQNISHELFITHENIASQAVGNSGNYKSYTRLIIPEQSKVIGVRSYDTYGNSEDLKYDIYDEEGRKEIGFLVNLLPSSSKKIQIVWDIGSENLTNGGEFRLFVRKQAGTDNDALLVQVQKSDLTLTGSLPSSYNTNLERDFNAKLFFKP